MHTAKSFQHLSLPIRRVVYVTTLAMLLLTTFACMCSAQPTAGSGSQDLSARLDKVEQQNRILMFGGVILVIGFVIYAGMRPSTRKESPGTTTFTVPSSSPVSAASTVDSAHLVRTRRLEVVDAMEVPRAIIEVGGEGEPIISLLDTSGNVRLRMSVDSPALSCADADMGDAETSQDVGTGLAVFGSDGNPRLVAKVDGDGTSHMSMADTENVVRVELAVDTDNCPRLDLNDTDGVARAEVTIDADGSPGMGIYHVDDNTSVSMTVDAEGKPCIAVSRQPDGIVWSAP